LQYTPEVSIAEEQTLLLDVTASLRLFGGPRSLYRQLARTLRQLQFTAIIGTAPTAYGAWLLANSNTHNKRRCLKLSTLWQRLDQLPCLSLPILRPYISWLDSIGCNTLGNLRQL